MEHPDLSLLTPNNALSMCKQKGTETLKERKCCKHDAQLAKAPWRNCRPPKHDIRLTVGDPTFCMLFQYLGKATQGSALGGSLCSGSVQTRRIVVAGRCHHLEMCEDAPSHHHPCQSPTSSKVGKHLLLIPRMHGVGPFVPVSEVEGEVAGWEAVVPVVVLDGVEGGLVPPALEHEDKDALDGGDEGRNLVPGMPPCTM